ncbi:hypothetical protein LVV98_22140, partial [Klebsiella pneumoniae]|nr:hypothetical protein [Klebsiella pneumoniae]
QTETEATGAPQKHHYTLNQQVGSITMMTGNIAPEINRILFCVMVIYSHYKLSSDQKCVLPWVVR